MGATNAVKDALFPVTSGSVRSSVDRSFHSARQPRRGERIEPTAQAVGQLRSIEPAPEGRKQRPTTAGESQASRCGTDTPVRRLRADLLVDRLSPPTFVIPSEVEEPAVPRRQAGTRL